MGNIDIRYSARCGAGYRDDAFVHGRAEVPVPEGEHTVTENLGECVRLIAEGSIRTEPLVSHKIPFADAPSAYELLRKPDAALGVLLDYDYDAG
jgi:threonine dehydrogenase-like Zn-dependent dehydrogenase